MGFSLSQPASVASVFPFMTTENVLGKEEKWKADQLCNRGGRKNEQRLVWEREKVPSAVSPPLMSHRNHETEQKGGQSFRTTPHLSHRCQRGGGCCPLPGCIGRGDCHWVRRLHRSRAGRWTGSRRLLAAGPGSLEGSRGRRRAPAPPAPCTWRTLLEKR